MAKVVRFEVANPGEIEHLGGAIAMMGCVLTSHDMRHVEVQGMTYKSGIPQPVIDFLTEQGYELTLSD